MNQTIKNLLGAALIIGVLVAAWAALVYAKASLLTNPRQFTVSAEGKAVGIPDVGEFTFSIITEGGVDLVKLQETNSEKSNKTIDYLKSQGVKTDDIKTESYNLSPRYEYFNCEFRSPCPPSQIVGYQINQTVAVKIRDLKQVGKLLSGVVSNGANSTSQLNFSVDDPINLENEARAQAIERAKKQAKAIAKASGFKLGRLLNIQESFYGIPRGLKTFALEADLGAPSLPPQIEPGSQEITINITLQYEIK